MQYRVLSQIKLAEDRILKPGDLYDGFTPEEAKELLESGAIKEEFKPFAENANEAQT